MAFSVSYVYQIIDRYTAPLKKINAQMERFHQKSKRTSKGLSNFSKKMVSAQSALATLGGVMAGANVLGTVIDFEKAMNKLGSVTLESDRVMLRFRDTAKQLGATTQFSASQAAQGMTFLAMAGLSTEQILAAIPDTLKLAAAGGLELANAADIATNVMAQMGFEAKDLGRINDVLSLAQSKANLNITELFDAMRPAAVTAKNLGLSLEETVAVLGTMANAGEKGSIAGTLFRNMLTKTAGAGKTALKIYKLLGVNLEDYINKAGKFTNFSGFVSKLKELGKEGKMSIPVLQALFGERGFRAAQILIGAGGDEISRFTGLLLKATGTADKASAVMMRGLPGVILSLSSAFEAFKIAVVESGIDKILIDAFQGVTQFLRELSASDPKLLKIIGIIGGIAIVAGPVLVALGLMSGGLSLIAGAFAALSAPVVLAFAAVGGSIALVVDWLVRAWDSSEKFRQGVGRFIDAFRPLGAIVSKILDPMIAAFDSLIESISTFLPSFEKVGDVLGTAFDFAAGGVEFAVGGISDLFGATPATAAAGGMQGSLNGRIEVSASGGAKVRRASLDTDLPGNMGMTLAGQR